MDFTLSSKLKWYKTQTTEFCKFKDLGWFPAGSSEHFFISNTSFGKSPTWKIIMNLLSDITRFFKTFFFFNIQHFHRIFKFFSRVNAPWSSVILHLDQMTYLKVIWKKNFLSLIWWEKKLYYLSYFSRFHSPDSGINKIKIFSIG